MGEPSAALDLVYQGDAATLGEARRAVIAWLSARGADEGATARAALIVSELATNALQACPGEAYKVHVARVDDHLAAISVRNPSHHGKLPPAPDQWRIVDRSSLRGRGLTIVKTLSEDVTIDEPPGEVVVTARIRL